MARPVGLALPRTITLLPEPSVRRIGQPKLNSPSGRLTASVTKPRVSGRSDDVPPGNIGTAGDRSTKVAIASALTPRQQLLATTIIQYPYVAILTSLGTSLSGKQNDTVGCWLGHLLRGRDGERAGSARQSLLKSGVHILTFPTTRIGN